MSRIALKLKREDMLLVLEVLETVIDDALKEGHSIDASAYVDLEDRLRSHLRAHDLAEARTAA